MTAEVLEISESGQEGITKTHVLFKVKVEGDVQLPEQDEKENESLPILPKKPIIHTDAFCLLFPYHVIFNKDLEIQQCGAKLHQLALKNIKVGSTSMETLFRILHPPIPFTFDRIQDFINANYLMEVRNTCGQNDNPLLIRGKVTVSQASLHSQWCL